MISSRQFVLVSFVYASTASGLLRLARLSSSIPPGREQCHTTAAAVLAPATCACAALLTHEDDQAPGSFSGLARYIALIGRYRQLAFLPVETPVQCARNCRSKYGRGGSSFGGAAVVSGGTTKAFQYPSSKVNSPERRLLWNDDY